MSYVNRQQNNLGYFGEGTVNWILDKVSAGQDFWKSHGSQLVKAGSAVNNAMRNISPEPPRIFNVSGLSYVAKVKAKKLNFRQSPSNNGQILGQLAEGQVISILGNVPNSPWGYMSQPFEGYVSNKTQYLEHVVNVQDTSSAAGQKTSEEQQGKVSKGSIDPMKMLQGEAGSALLVGGLAVGLVLVLMSRK